MQCDTWHTAAIKKLNPSITKCPEAWQEVTSWQAGAEDMPVKVDHGQTAKGYGHVSAKPTAEKCGCVPVT